jgi:alkylation response protein AidB-like acyl-CoA dehydrogenase
VVDSVSFMSALCMGEIEEDLIIPFPKLKESERETLLTVKDSIDAMLAPREKDFAAWDRAGELPKEFLQELREFGMFGFVIPEEFGGMGFGSVLARAARDRPLRRLGSSDRRRPQLDRYARAFAFRNQGSARALLPQTLYR